ncbi:hypothetical protein AXF42_Ash006466 [Apostasia shenzhenica]|uniref:Transmembrane protein n=1 Tax=Apostasia shenzhenica TaxID=1088818 RepID=A0A2I0AZ58_9ASPA|nr:hypothetical protein AXF42_Ash006466 [Apostasia shenzhenica]
MPYSGIFFHAAASSTASLLVYFLNLPAVALQGLHTYIHPDSLLASDGTKALLRRPGAAASALSEPKRRPRSKDAQPSFDESKAQLFRIRLTDSLLPSRLFFSSYRSAFLSSFVALSNLVLCLFLLLPGSFTAVVIPIAAVLISAAQLLVFLLKLSLERSASRHSDRRLSLLSAAIGFLFSIFVLNLSPSVINFRIPTFVTPIAAAFAGFLSGILFIPAGRSARAFWLGTDQLRWNLSVVSCGTIGRVMLYLAAILNFFSSLMWVNPLAIGERFEECRVWALTAAAISQLLVLRSNVQMYLNEAVLCWYQRLHSSRVPDMDYGRAKVFLHNHFVCLAVIQFFAPPLLVLLFAGLSQIRGNLFEGIPFIGGLTDFSVVVKEMALFMAWWIMSVHSALMMLMIAFYRCGFAFVS